MAMYISAQCLCTSRPLWANKCPAVGLQLVGGDVQDSKEFFLKGVEGKSQPKLLKQSNVHECEFLERMYKTISSASQVATTTSFSLLLHNV